jgi:hypothetical protein
LFFFFFFALFEVVAAVFFLEAFYSACGIDVFLLSRIERMANRADFCVYFLCGAAGLERIAAPAVDHHLMIFRMYVFLHKKLSQSLKQNILIETPAFSSKFFVIFRSSLCRIALNGGDGTVDFKDLDLLVDHWLEGAAL